MCSFKEGGFQTFTEKSMLGFSVSVVQQKQCFSQQRTDINKWCSISHTFSRDNFLQVLTRRDQLKLKETLKKENEEKDAAKKKEKTKKGGVDNAEGGEDGKGAKRKGNEKSEAGEKKPKKREPKSKAKGKAKAKAKGRVLEKDEKSDGESEGMVTPKKRLFHDSDEENEEHKVIEDKTASELENPSRSQASMTAQPSETPKKRAKAKAQPKQKAKAKAKAKSRWVWRAVQTPKFHRHRSRKNRNAGRKPQRTTSVKVLRKCLTGGCRTSSRLTWSTSVAWPLSTWRLTSRPTCPTRTTMGARLPTGLGQPQVLVCLCIWTWRTLLSPRHILDTSASSSRRTGQRTCALHTLLLISWCLALRDLWVVSCGYTAWPKIVLPKGLPIKGKRSKKIDNTQRIEYALESWIRYSLIRHLASQNELSPTIASSEITSPPDLCYIVLIRILLGSPELSKAECGEWFVHHGILKLLLIISQTVFSSYGLTQLESGGVDGWPWPCRSDPEPEGPYFKGWSADGSHQVQCWASSWKVCWVSRTGIIYQSAIHTQENFSICNQSPINLLSSTPWKCSTLQMTFFFGCSHWVCVGFGLPCCNQDSKHQITNVFRLYALASALWGLQAGVLQVANKTKILNWFDITPILSNKVFYRGCSLKKLYRCECQPFCNLEVVTLYTVCFFRKIFEVTCTLLSCSWILVFPISR